MSEPKLMTTSLGPDPNAINGIDGVHENEWYNQNFGDYTILEQPMFTKHPIRLVCVGAGATGLQLAYKAERLLENVTLQIYEKNGEIGGTWLENKYPGVACDIPSHSYQFSWARNPSWSRYYSPGNEIWQYFKDVATKYNLERYVKLSHRVQSAKWDEDKGVWKLTIGTPDGGTITDECEILVNGSGILNKWKWPDIPGLETFKGKMMHSAAWDADYDLKDKTVAVIGGGSSAVQLIPLIQPVAKKLVPFLRSPVWITMGFGAKFAGPGGTNFEYPKEQIESFINDPTAYDKYCRELDGELNKRFTLNHFKSTDQKLAREQITNMMSDQLNRNEELTQHLTPNFAIGCRRMTPGSGYLESLTKDNVEVVKTGAARLTEDGVIDEDGKEHKVDVVICSTGFDNSFAPPYECIGRNGTDLREKFGDFPKGYLSIMVDEFPNLFLFIGPNGPASHSSVLPILEWHTRYLFQMINKLQRENIRSFTPKAECVQDFSQHTHTLMKRLVWSAACRSWFKNGKTHGPVTAIWPGSRLHYFEALKDPRYEDFDIVYRSKNRFQFMGNGYTEEEVRPDGNPVWYFDDPFCKTTHQDGISTPSYTKVTHSATYPAINPTQPGLSTKGKVVLITGASGGIGRATASSFAASGPRALILLGRRSDALAETANVVKSKYADLTIQTHEVDLLDSTGVRSILANVATEFGSIDILVHSAGVLAPVVPLVEADPATFLDGYKTTVVGTLVLAQAVVLANKEKEVTFINLTTAGILFPPFSGMGAYVSSKMAAVKLLQSFAAENPQVRLHNVHPGFLDTAMSTQLSKTTKLPYGFDDISLPSDYLVWIASPEASFLNGKLVFSAWDVEELKNRKKEIVGGPPGTGELWLSFSGFPRYVAGNPLPGVV
ncbi:FAD-binding monooxygenase moxY [Cladobotryum mycophilum]|uniref:FAD-binding monooxygenase moxY n=1 Tax=Cladobotryum mycophilum TaxID=491253 RepID=A0ABR0SDQ0_9HYPO